MEGVGWRVEVGGWRVEGGGWRNLISVDANRVVAPPRSLFLLLLLLFFVTLKPGVE